jgi:histidyl-tRNA synthetase
MVNIKDSDKTLSILPLHHTYECTLDFILFLTRGATVCYCEGLTKVQKNLTEYSPTILVAVPALLKVLNKRIKKAIAADCPAKYKKYFEEETLENGDVRNVMHLHPALAPFKCAVLPLQKKLSEKALEIHAELAKYFPVDYDEAGSIGKRYRRQDENGTPYCVTVDFDTIENGTVTVRDRDTMEQITLKIEEVKDYIKDKLVF